MDTGDIVRSLLALIFVIGLMLGCAALARRMGWLQPFTGPVGERNRLAVEDTLMLDPRHRLVLVRADASRLLVLLGPSGAQILPHDTPSTDHAGTANGGDAV